MVSTSQVEKYKDEDPGWKSRSPQEIGERFHADYVIDLEINSLTLYKPGSANTLFLGKAVITLDVVDVHRAGDGPIYHEVYTCEYPRIAEIPATDSDSEQFRQRFLSVIAKQLSWRFTAHPVEDDYDCR